MKKNKCVKVNTTHCRGETKLIRKLINRNGWKEVFSDG